MAAVVGVAFVGIARLLIVWSYAQRELSAPAPGGSALPWLALWFVPQLLGRLFLYEELAAFGDMTRIGLLLGAATAIAIIVAARTGRLWWLPATLAGALFALGVYVTHTQPDRFGIVGNTIIGPLAMMFAALATAAWFARRVPSP